MLILGGGPAQSHSLFMLLKMSAVWSLSDWPSLTRSSRPYIELLGPRDVLLSGRAGQLGGWVWSLPSLWASAAVRLVRVHQLVLVKAVDVVRGANLGEVVTNNPETLTCCF